MFHLTIDSPMIYTIKKKEKQGVLLQDVVTALREQNHDKDSIP